MDVETKNSRKLLRVVSITCFVFSVLWIMINPYVSVSCGFKKPSLIHTVDKNIPTSLAVVATNEDKEYAIEVQNEFCEIDYDDVNMKLEAIKKQFEKIGMSFTTHSGDSSLVTYVNKTSIDLLPTVIFGVWHPVQSVESPTSIILSTELNFNSTANPKASHYNTDCSYSIPSSISVMLSLIHSMQESGKTNHDIVFVIHLNKYNAITNRIIQQVDIEFITHQINLPLFSIHMEYPGSVISFSDTIIGYDLFTMGLNGKNANLDLVSVVLQYLPILHYHSDYSSFGSYTQNVALTAVGRNFGIQQYYLLNGIPAVSLKAVTKPATLEQRTHQGKDRLMISLMTDMKRMLTTISSVEERIQRNDNRYIPLFTGNPRETRYVHKMDLINPGLLMIISTVLLMLSYNQFQIPSKPSFLYCGLIIVVQGGYLILARLMAHAEKKGEVSGGLAVFVLFVIVYSSWCYYRLIYNNAMISKNVCTEETYKREIFSTTGVLTILISLLYLFVNPGFVIVHMMVYYLCVLVLLVFVSQNARYVLLFLYSSLLALPFMLIVNDEFYDWCFSVLLFTKNDYFFMIYILVVVVGNLAILHYVNGLSFIRLDDEEEKEKMD